MKKIVLLSLLVVSLLPLATSAQETSNPVQPALLVIDVQNNYLPMMDQSGQQMAVRLINGAIWQFRNKNFPIIRVYHTDLDWGPEPGSDEFEFAAEINIQQSDPQIIKNYPSAFTQTNLDTVLKEKGVNTVFLCGLSATGCVLATYFGAQDRQYDVFLVEGALMSPNAEHTETIKDILGSVGWDGLDVMLKAAAH